MVSIKGDLEKAKIEFCANQRKKMSNGNDDQDQDDDMANDADEEEEKSNFLLCYTYILLFSKEIGKIIRIKRCNNTGNTFATCDVFLCFSYVFLNR